MNIISLLSDTGITRVLVKIFLIPALILLAISAFVFHMQYKSRIDNVMQGQRHHLEIANSLINYEIRNATADIRQLMQNPEVEHFLRQPFISQSHQVEATMVHFSRYQPQYLATAFCDPAGHTLLRSTVASLATSDIPFCQQEDLRASGAKEFSLTSSMNKNGSEFAIITAALQDGNHQLYFQVVYDVMKLIALLDTPNSYADDFYILPSPQTLWQTSEKDHLNHRDLGPVKLSPRGAQGLPAHGYEQQHTENGVYSLTTFQLDPGIAQMTSPWELLTYNHDIQNTLQQELIYFSAITAITLIVLFSIGLFYYNNSRNSRRFQMELYEDRETGVYNRRFLESQLPLYIEKSRHFDLKLLCIYLEIDDISLHLQHKQPPERQEILRHIAERIRNCVRKSDIVSRVGEGQFVILMPFIEKMYIGPRTATKMLEALNQCITFKNREMNFGGSIGISNYPQHGDQLETLLAAADLAMYDVKRASKNSYKIADTLEF